MTTQTTTPTPATPTHRRKPECQDRSWSTYCRDAGVDPDTPVALTGSGRVVAQTADGVRIGAEQRWEPTCFEPLPSPEPATPTRVQEQLAAMVRQGRENAAAWREEATRQRVQAEQADKLAAEHDADADEYERLLTAATSTTTTINVNVVGPAERAMQDAVNARLGLLREHGVL